MLDQLNLFGSKKIVENEIEVIRSRGLAQEIVKKLRLYAPVYREGGWSDKAAYTETPVWVEVPKPDSLEPVKKIPVSVEAGHVVAGGKPYPANKWVETPYGQLRFVLNPRYKKQENEESFYFSLVRVRDVARGMVDAVKVKPTSKQSTVVNITYRDEVPQRAEDILNQWVHAYNQAAITDKHSLASNTLSFVEDRLQLVVNELDSVEKQIERYKSKNNIMDISTQGQLFLQSVGQNDQKMGEMNMQLAALDQVEQYVVAKGNKGGIVPSSLGVADPVLSSLLEKLYEAEMQYERLKGTTAENNHMLLSLQDQIQKIKPNILENIRNQRKTMVAGRSDLQSTNNKYTSMLSTLPAKERELLDISRQQSIKNSIYTYLLQKREETALSHASIVPDSRVVDVAETASWPVAPKPMLVYITGLAISLILVILFVSLKGALNMTVGSRAEVEQATEAPIVGEIIQHKENTDIVIGEGQRTFIAEQFRHLRTSLGYLGITPRKNKILITSTLSGEGKSFVTANLGISLSLVGKKVVLVELDLCKPKLSTIFNIPQTVGVADYLAGNASMASIVQPIKGHGSLHIIPSGPIPANPSELILDKRLPELLRTLEQEYDYVLIDTSPVNPVSDAYVLSPLCDATLYIIRHGYTPRAVVQKLDEGNKIKELKNMALVLNGIKENGFGSSRYQYSLGYDYGYTKNPKSGRRLLSVVKKKVTDPNDISNA
ncbi:MAG TPA: polysaccharide biosynthesis tyrosine autokinase, partial [Chitinophagaceae bacterium]|nr:polysaccharide biosynthesis tyrosine autokinase [Chitinophagaceae bacterium]